MMLEEAIVDLLLQHNCVVVPSFGGFIAQSSSAVIDVRNGVMLPPRKSVLFNRQLINNDGLLISYLSSAEGMNYADAEISLKNQVTDWQIQLQEGKRVSIDKIGHLYLDAERNISFEQDRFFNLLLQSYGLNKVHFIAEEEVKIAEYQHRPEKIEVATVIHEEEKIDFSPREIQASTVVPEPAGKIIELYEEPNRKKLWKYAVAAALLPFAFYTYWIPMKTNVLESGMISIKDFNPMYQSGAGIYLEKKLTISTDTEPGEKTLVESIEDLSGKVDVYSYKFDDDFYIPVRLNNGDQAESERTVTTKTKVDPEIDDLLPKENEKSGKKANLVPESKMNSPQYIVGAFSNSENAQSLLEVLKGKGLNPRIVDLKDGLIRVSAGGSDNVIEMESIVEKSETAGYKGWILQ